MVCEGSDSTPARLRRRIIPGLIEPCTATARFAGRYLTRKIQGAFYCLMPLICGCMSSWCEWVKAPIVERSGPPPSIRGTNCKNDRWKVCLSLLI
jgi:hypothetical protein